MTGDFLLIHYGYDGDFAPQLTLLRQGGDTFEHFTPRHQTFTLTADTSTRFCNGWHNLETGESFPCPDSATLPAQFSQCRHCQQKTGFNPAFYHAASISPQQQARNAQPHFLYLAHFAPGVVKVGISWAERGIRRLLDQGARSCVIIKTYTTATLARQYEAKIAALPDIAETLQIKTKHALLKRDYDHAAAIDELRAVRSRIAQECHVTPDDHEPTNLDHHYLEQTPLNKPIILPGPAISGRCLGMIGNTLVTEQNDQQYGLCVSSLTGYPITITSGEQPNAHAPQQISLF